MIATSADGLNFTKLDKILYNFADVPDAVVSASNRAFVYFQGIQEPLQDVILVGTSADGISNWSFQPIRIVGTEGWPVRPCDPDVVFKDLLFRMYFTGDPLGDRVPETYSATSNDGINFALESGVRFSGGDRSVLDPSLLWTGDTLHYFAGGGSPTQNWHAVSVNGLQFTRVEDFSVGGMMMSNGIKVKGGYRFYGFPNKPPPDLNIQSIFSADGRSWSPDPGIRLARDGSSAQEALYVKDPAIIFKDSIYIMYYVTRKPEYTGVDKPERNLPQEFQLFQNHPNPFNPTTRIEYFVTKPAFVTLRVFNAVGRQIATLVQERKEPGSYHVDWRPEESSGIYYYRVQAGDYVETKKMALLK
jgi:hypothetical protein